MGRMPKTPVMLQFGPTMFNPALYPDTSNGPTMPAENWFSTSEFTDLWKSAFSNSKTAFPGLPEDVRPRAKREKTGALWVEIHNLSPGIHLLAIEFQTEVYPLSIRLKVWIDQSFPELYASLRRAEPPAILGKKTQLFPDQEPRPSWKGQLSAKGITLIGLSYKVDDLSFLSPKETASRDLRRMGAEFFEWLAAQIADRSKTSTSSKSSNLPLLAGDENSPLLCHEPAEAVGKSEADIPAQSAQDLDPEIALETDNISQLLNWQKALAAVTQQGGTASRSQVEAWILERDPGYNTNNSRDLYMMSVNSPARTGYPQNSTPRRTDQGNRYDRLFKVGEAIFELYDPAQHGIWEIYSSPTSGSRFGVSIRRISDPVEEAISAAEEEAEQTDAFDPTSIVDARQRVTGDIVRRRGQPKFRKALMATYGSACAITGCTLPAVLEAAHIYPYKGVHTNALSNGLLLRADVHTLFDLHMIAIDSETMEIRVSPELVGTAYESLKGTKLRHPKDRSHRASPEALEWHLSRCSWCD